MHLKRNILAILILLTLSSFTHGQDDRHVADSLETYNARIDSIFTTAQALIDQGDLVHSDQLAEELLTTGKRLEDHRAKAYAYFLQGQAREKQHELAAALRDYFMAVKEFEWTDKIEMTASVFIRMGDIYLDQQLYAKASEYYSRARGSFPGATTMKSAELDERRASAFYLQNEYDSALLLYKELYAFYEPGRPDMAMSTLMQLTSCLYEMGRYQEALAYNEEALEIARDRTKDPKDEVEALNSLGYNYKYLQDFEQSVDYFELAVALASKELPGDEIYPVALVNLAIAEQNQGDLNRALESFFTAIKVTEEQSDINEQGRVSYLLSYVYYLNKDYHNAGVYNRKAMDLARNSGNEVLLQNCLHLASLISTSLYDYEQAMIYYQEYLSLRDSLETQAGIARQNLAQQEYTVERTEKELSQILYEREIQNMEVKNLKIEAEKREQELDLLRKTSELQDATIRNKELEKNRAMQELLLAEERLAAEKKDREIKDLKLTQQLQESELKRKELEQIRAQQDIEVLTKQKELNELTIEKIRARNAFLAGIVLLVMVVLVLLIIGLRYARKTNRTLKGQRNKIQQQKEAIESQYEIIKVEREKSEKLLLNILPEETAQELKEKGRAVPREYRMVTVLFTDFVKFTQVAEKLTPEELINELDLCFAEFDHIISRHNLEKIKTIGDAYMCAGGIPVENASNAMDAVAAALEIRDFMEKERNRREKKGQEYWQLRIGIHTGEVVAGVVGKMKFAYDIWGDAVNTASRMESSGETGKVNISGSTYEIVRDHFKCTYRGKVYAKNKGDIDMYFVDHPG